MIVEETTQFFDDNGDFHICHKGKEIIIRKQAYDQMNINQLRDITLPSAMEKYPIDKYIIDETIPDDIVILEDKEK